MANFFDTITGRNSNSNFAKAFNNEKYGPALNAAMGLAGNIGGTLIGGGYSSAAGDITSGLANVASAIPGPWGAVAGAGLSIVGGLVNRAFGAKWNKENINAVESNIRQMNNFQSNAGDFDSLSRTIVSAPSSMRFGESFIGKNGWFNHKATRKFNKLTADQADAADFVANSINNNLSNITATQAQNMEANYAALGGPLSIKGNGVMSPFGKRFDYGGLLSPFHRNGGDWSNGLIFINAGDSHESNPLGGVLMGIAPDGKPNLVEEGEVIWNDYVFSDTLKIPKGVKHMFKLGGVKELTFADAVKRIQKESEERPNDPISQRGLDNMLLKLAIAQEAKRQQSGASNKNENREEPMYYAANGGRINISPSKRGTFTAAATKHGMSVPEFAAQVLSNPDNYSPAMVKKANFARNAAKWHALGGPLANVFWPGGPLFANTITGRLPFTLNMVDTPSEGGTSNLSQWTGRGPLKGDIKNWFFDANQLTDDAYNAMLNQYHDITQKDISKYKGNRNAFFNYANSGKPGDAYGVITNGYNNRGNEPGGLPDQELPEVIVPGESSKIKNPWNNPGFDATVKGGIWTVPDFSKHIQDLREGKIQFNPDNKYGVLPNGTELLDDPEELADFLSNPVNRNSALSKVWYNQMIDLNKPPETLPKKPELYPMEHGIASGLRFVPPLAKAGLWLTDTLGYTNQLDTSSADALDAATRELTPIGAPMLGNYVKPVSFDLDYDINRMDDTANSAMRGIINSSAGNRGQAISGLVALANNTLNNFGNLRRESKEFGSSQEMEKAKYNRETDEINARNIMAANTANIGVTSERLQNLAKALTLKEAAKTVHDKAISSNAMGLLKDIQGIGEEGEQRDWLRFLVNNNVFGTTPEQGLREWWKAVDATERAVKGASNLGKRALETAKKYKRVKRN